MNNEHHLAFCHPESLQKTGTDLFLKAFIGEALQASPIRYKQTLTRRRLRSEQVVDKDRAHSHWRNVTHGDVPKAEHRF